MILTIDEITFTATIVAYDVAITHILVQYDPEDPDLMSTRLNVPINEKREWRHGPTGELEQVPNEYTLDDHIEYSIRCGAPIQQWRNQKILINYLASK